MQILTPRGIEQRFGADPEAASFPHLCNAIISHEAPSTSSFPVLTAKAGPDGGIDGEWNLTQSAPFEPVSIAREGWNIYQYKTLDSSASGAKRAFDELRKRARGAVSEIITRSAEGRVPVLYVLFTNLQLGPETPSTTRAGKKLNTQRERLSASLLEGAPAHVAIEIIDAAQIVGFVERHPALRLSWFSPQVGSTWKEMQREEQQIQPAATDLLGREDELASIQRWLEDSQTRVVAVSGPNSVGKTRLCIEATRRFEPITLYVKDAAEVHRIGLAALATPQRPAIIVAEDPPLDLIEALAKQAVSAPHALKLLITIPSQSSAPAVSAAPDTRVKELVVKPVPRHTAEKIIKRVNPAIDHRVQRWIAEQAGGLPGVLVAAATLGNELMRGAGSLREQLVRHFANRPRLRADRETLQILRVLSAFVYVNTAGSSPELQTLLAAIGGTTATVAGVRQRLPELERFGYVRRRGDFVAVTPPLFAAGLFQELIDADSGLPLRLFQGADFAVRVRLLERLVMLGLPENHAFWGHMFGGDGPFGEPQRFAANFNLLDYLARAVPKRIARYLRRELDFVWTEVLPKAPRAVSHLLETLHELLDGPATATNGFQIVLELAKREAAAGRGTTFGRLFTECFVHWYICAIPYPLKNQTVDALMLAIDPAHRQLSVKALIAATDPPQTLSGRVSRAQRLYSQPNYGTWRELYDFLLGMMRRRLACCTSNDPELRNLSLVNITHALTKLSERLPVPDALIIIRETTQDYFDGKLPVDMANLHEQIRRVRDRFERNEQKFGRGPGAQDWSAAVTELDELLIRLMGGAFENRLMIALSQSSRYEKVTMEDRELYAYEAEILQLVREVCAAPHLLDDEAWMILNAKEAAHANDFFLHLGEEDQRHRLFPGLLDRAVDEQTSRWLGCYLRGSPAHTNKWLKAILRGLKTSTAPAFPLLPILKFVGPTATARRCLSALLARKLVSTSEVAAAFTTGRWLDDLPVPEVLPVLNFIASEPDHAAKLLMVVWLYLHHAKPLPRELFPVVWSALTAPAAWGTWDGDTYNHAATGLARTDLEEGFRLLGEVTAGISGGASDFSRSGWDPFGEYSSHDFWVYLRDQAPKRAYRMLGGLSSLIGSRSTHGGGERSLLDLSKHWSILLAIAHGDETSARAFASCLLPSMPEFFSFAAELIEAHPGSMPLRDTLREALLPHGGFGTSYDELSAMEIAVQAEFESFGVAPVVSDWLQGLLEAIEQRKKEEHPRGTAFSEPDFSE